MDLPAPAWLPALAIGCAPATETHDGGDPDPGDEIVALDCADPIDTLSEIPDDYEAIAEAIALPTEHGADEALAVSDADGTGVAFQLFAKAGLLLRTEAHAELIVPNAWRGEAGIWWGNTGGQRPVSAFVIGACPGASGWLVYPGGFWINEPACLPLHVRADGVTHEISIGVGAPCPGQSTPD